MKNSCWIRFFLVLALVLILVSEVSTFLSRAARLYTSQEVFPVRVEDVKIFMKYHGTHIARYDQEKKQWFFLDKNGRWLPLKTAGACRYFASISPRPDASCLF